MNALIIVDSEFGNTARVAECIAEGLAPLRASVRRLPAGDTRDAIVPELDLLVVGGPTMNRGMSPRLRAAHEWIAELARVVPSVAFDTRLRAPRIFTGSAAKELTEHLRGAGAPVIASPESFLVYRPAGPGKAPLPTSAVTLVDGELERARDWAASLADRVVSTRAA